MSSSFNWERYGRKRVPNDQRTRVHETRETTVLPSSADWDGPIEQVTTPPRRSHVMHAPKPRKR